MRRGSRKAVWIRAVIAGVLTLAVLVTALVLLQREDDAHYAEKRGTMSENFGQLRTVEWNGSTWREKPAVTTILIGGIDKTDVGVEGSYRHGGQADFLMLLAIDQTDKKIHQLQIDRDTMTDVQILGVFGNEVGTRVLQICLAHAFGASPADNAKYTVKAVQNLLEGIEIDGYYMVDYGAVPVLNDALGGITVHLDYDMTSVNPDWEKGKTVTLHGQDAELFVRARLTIGSGTNEERMVRQNEFMKNAIATINKKISADLSFGESLLDTLSDIAETNFTKKRLLEELNVAYNFEVLPVDHPAGEYAVGPEGFIEFHMQEGAAVEWVLNHLYTKVK